MTGLGNSGWLKGESRWKPPRVAAAAVDMKQPVVEEEAQRRAAKCKHQLNSPAPIVWRRRGRSHAKVGFTPAHVNRKNKGGEEEKTSWIERASVRLSLTARWVEFAKNCSLSPPYLSCLSAARGLVRSWHTGLWTLWTANHLRTALLKHYFSSQPSQYITFRLKKKIRSCFSSPRQWGE